MAKQAKIFQEQDLFKYLEMPTTVDNLLVKVFTVVSLFFAARGIEASAVKWEDVESSVTESGETKVAVSSLRKKQNGVPEISIATISGGLEINIINEYEACL